MKVSELKKYLKIHGCRMMRQRSNHEIWQNPKNGHIFPVPRHNTKEIPAGTLKSILDLADL